MNPELANNIYVVFVAYLCAFLPWTVFDGTQFIGSKWKSIKTTQSDGLTHLFWLCVPTAYIVFYVYLQGVCQDYKEMFTAIVALLLSILRLVRTCWGLLQLHCFHQWAIRSVASLDACKIKYKIIQKDQNMKKDKNDSQDTNDKGLESIMINERIIDNQILHGESRCYLKYRERSIDDYRPGNTAITREFFLILEALSLPIQYVIHTISYRIFGKGLPPSFGLVPRNKRELWVKWVTILAVQDMASWSEDFGSFSTSFTTPPNEEEKKIASWPITECQCAGEILAKAGLHLVSPSICDHWLRRRNIPGGRVTKHDLLKHALHDGPVLPYGQPMDVSRKGFLPKVHGEKVSIFTKSITEQFGEKVLNFDVARLEWFTILLHMGSDHNKKGDEQSEDRKNSQAFGNLKEQLGLTNDQAPNVGLGPNPLSILFEDKDVEKQINLLSKNNKFGLELGEYIDVWISLTAGEQNGKQDKKTGEQDAARGNHSPLPNLNLKKEQRDIETTRLKDHGYSHPEKGLTFMGYQMEMVRTYLERWRGRKRSCTESIWKPNIRFSKKHPTISNRKVEALDFSKDSRLDFMEKWDNVKSFHMHLIRDLQTALHRTKNLKPNSEELMILCILSFPNLVVTECEGEIQRQENTVINLCTQKLYTQKKNLPFLSLKIKPYSAPQQLFICIKLVYDDTEYVTASVCLNREDKDCDGNFHWNLWRDSFTSLMKTGTASKKEYTPPSSSAEDSHTNNSIVCGLDLPGKFFMGSDYGIETWKGWKPFRNSLAFEE